MTFNKVCFVFISLAFYLPAFTQNNREKDTRIVPVANGWAKNSINTVVFRKNSLVSYKDTQFIAFYDTDKNVVLGKRRLGETKWNLLITQYKGNTNDAHNDISIMVDGAGYLHMAWDHHNNPVNYCKSIAPLSLILTDKIPMTGKKESKVSYPEFYKMPGGNILFFYRDGGSGNGNLMIDLYNVQRKQWTQVQDGLINGEGKRNAYWQTAVDNNGTIHLSWVWRESPDVASNHDMCYAKSTDGGITWEKSTGEKYKLPITAATAEYACKIPQRSELINQTSMCADEDGNPYIATYWRSEGSAIPQYRLVYNNGHQWKTLAISKRVTPFTLSGAGTKKIPVSRPQIVVQKNKKTNTLQAVMLFRDEERGSKVSAAICDHFPQGDWIIKDLTETTVDNWEPTYDTELWKTKHVLHLFVEKVEQGDGEKLKESSPQIVSVLEWKVK